MNTKVEDSGPCRKILHVDVGWSDVEADYRTLLTNYAAAAAVPGFRPGKAPVAVVEKRYFKGILEDAKERFLPKFYRAAMEAEGLKPVAVVEVNDVDLVKDRGLRFRVTLDVAPQFKLPKYQKLSLKGNEVKVGDKEIDEAIVSLRERLARYEDVAEARAVRQADLVRVNFQAVCDGQPVAAMGPDCVALGAGTDFWMLVGEPEFVPGLAAGLTGANVDEERTVPVSFPADYRVKALAGKQAVYTITVKGIRERLPAKMDEEFLKGLNIENVEALRARVGEDLQRSGEEREKDRLREEISKFLLEKTELDLPQSLVDREARHVFYTMVRSLYRQGATHEDVNPRREQLVKDASRIGTDRVKLTFVLKAIAAEEKIEVSDQEVDDRIKSMAEGYRVPPERLRKEMEERDDDLSDLRDEILCGKTMDFLLETAKVKK